MRRAVFGRCQAHGVEAGAGRHMRSRTSPVWRGSVERTASVTSNDRATFMPGLATTWRRRRHLRPSGAGARSSDTRRGVPDTITPPLRGSRLPPACGGREALLPLGWRRASCFSQVRHAREPKMPFDARRCQVEGRHFPMFQAGAPSKFSFSAAGSKVSTISTRAAHTAVNTHLAMDPGVVRPSALLEQAARA